MTVNKQNSVRLYLSGFTKFRLFRYIGMQELLADTGMIIFSILFSHFAIGESNITETFSPVMLLFIFGSVVFCMPIFLGYLYPFYKFQYAKKIATAVKSIFILVVLFMMIFMFYILIRLDKDPAGTSIIKEHFFIFGALILVLGPLASIGGYLIGNDLLKNERDHDGVVIISFFIGLAIGLAFMVWLWFRFHDSGHQNILYAIFYLVLSLLSAGIVCVVFMLLFLLLRKLIMERGWQLQVQLLFNNLLPFFIIVMLIYWNELGIGIIREVIARTKLSSTTNILLIPVLILTGYVPFRVVLMFAPPVRLLNIIIGAGGILFYILKNLQVLGK